MKVKRREPQFEAITFDGTNGAAVARFIGTDTDDRGSTLYNADLMRRHEIETGDVLVRLEDGVDVCSPAEFAAEFEEIPTA